VNVTVRLFATLRQQAGWAEKSVRLAEGATVASLLAFLDEDEGLDLRMRTVYAAVNETYVDADHALAEGDNVALFPPVSGGSSRRSGPSGSFHEGQCT
jgi:molybdopterin converting factor subunit 1